jgi:hypothetical protein
MTHFEPGRYLGRVEKQQFVESKNGTPGFRLTVRIVENLEEPDATVKPSLRNMTWWITPKTKTWVWRDLHTLGYTGDELDGIDPDNKGFHDFGGQEIELTCKHEVNQTGDTFECWSLSFGNMKLMDKSKLRHFDR